MPYIKQSDRDVLNNYVDLPASTTPGELAYLFHRLIARYLIQTGVTYQNLATTYGIIGTVKDEFYRRVVAPYEDKKIEENGDVTWYEFS